jgi:hypothetical protein
VLATLNEQGKGYFGRLERLAELVLKSVALKNEEVNDSRDEVP